MRLSLLMGFVLGSSSVAVGQNALQVDATLRATDAGAFGFAFDIDGDTLVASKSTSLFDGSTVKVFVRQNLGWIVQQTLSGPGFGFGGGDGSYSNTIDHDGERLVIASPLRDEVHVYLRTSGVYGIEQVLTGTSSSRFGSSVALRGDRLVVGARSDDVAGSDAGAAFVYERTGGVWVLVQSLRPPMGSTAFSSGFSLALEGETLAIAEPGAGVRVFDRVGGTWVQNALLPFAAEGGLRDVALSGDTLVAGGTLSSLGTVRIWRRTSSVWNDEQTLVGSFVGFGHSVDVLGDELIVGEPYGPISPNFQGHAYRYRRSGSTWSLLGDLGAPVPSGGDGHGYGVALDGVTAVVGTPGDDVAGTNNGAVTVYRMLGTLGQEVCSGTWPAPCPCMNWTDASLDEGCSNSTGHGAFLQAFGSASVAADDSFTRVNHVRPGAPVLLFQGSVPAAGAGSSFRDGVLCVGGTLRRLRTASANSSGVATIGPGLATPGAWVAGQSIVLQGWHRDALGPCGLGSNLSQAVQVVLAP